MSLRVNAGTGRDRVFPAGVSTTAPVTKTGVDSVANRDRRHIYTQEGGNTVGEHGRDYLRLVLPYVGRSRTDGPCFEHGKRYLIVV